LSQRGCKIALARAAKQLALFRDTSGLIAPCVLYGPAFL
jgi:hypothetical protein